MSSVPPSHAPDTTGGMSKARATHGISTIIGIATTRTSDVTYDSLRRSPWMAPQVAMAADTPQIDTALASIVASSSSTRIRLASQNEKAHTLITTTSACRMPSMPAPTISSKRIVAPSTTRPVLM